MITLCHPSGSPVQRAIHASSGSLRLRRTHKLTFQTLPDLRSLLHLPLSPNFLPPNSSLSLSLSSLFPRPRSAKNSIVVTRFDLSLSLSLSLSFDVSLSIPLERIIPNKRELSRVDGLICTRLKTFPSDSFSIQTGPSPPLFRPVPFHFLFQRKIGFPPPVGQGRSRDFACCPTPAITLSLFDLIATFVVRLSDVSDASSTAKFRTGQWLDTFAVRLALGG